MTNIVEKTTINAPANEVWKTIRSFGGVEKYLPIVTHSVVEGNGVGSTRTCTIQGLGGQGDSKAIEKLDYINDEERTIAYSIIEAPMPVKNFVNTVQVIDLGNNKSEIEWQSSFESNGVPEDQAKKMIQDIIIMASKGLKKLHEN